MTFVLATLTFNFTFPTLYYVTDPNVSPNRCQNVSLFMTLRCLKFHFTWRYVTLSDVWFSDAETDYCSPNPCQNGGRCYWSWLGPICTCAKGFSGSTCGDGEWNFIEGRQCLFPVKLKIRAVTLGVILLQLLGKIELTIDLYLPPNRACEHCASKLTIWLLAEFDWCASDPCLERCVPLIQRDLLVVPLTQRFFLQSLTSVPPPRVCTEVCVPPIKQDSCVYCASHSILSYRVWPVCLLLLYACRTCQLCLSLNNVSYGVWPVCPPCLHLTIFFADFD